MDSGGWKDSVSADLRGAASGGEAARGDRGPALTGNFQHGGQDGDLFQTIRTGIPGTQMPGFAALPSDSIWRIITYVRTLDVNRGNDAEKVAGDVSAGETLFFGKAGCGQCHEVNGRGGVMAGDLSAIGIDSAASICAAGFLHPGEPERSEAEAATRSEPRNPRGGGGGNEGPLTPLTERVNSIRRMELTLRACEWPTMASRS